MLAVSLQTVFILSTYFANIHVDPRQSYNSDRNDRLPTLNKVCPTALLFEYATFINYEM
jgi:hypothetical protein